MSPPGTPQSRSEQLVDHATCLGCGCACDDITVRLTGGRIADAQHACARGVTWFGNGDIPSLVRVDGRTASEDEATAAIAGMLGAAARPLVYLAPELSCEAQRAAIALADRLHASLDTVTSATALNGILASQERGRAGATLGEIRHRADVLVFWGVDPNERYPRYGSRYAPEPSGLHVPLGRRSRTVIAVDVGDARGPQDADHRVAVGADEEVAFLTAVTALVRQPDLALDARLLARAASLSGQLTAGRYTVVVADGEPPVSSKNDSRPHFQDPQRAAALIALTQALNGPTRAALSTLRAGGNRTGAEAMMTAQTGFPTAVSFWRGVPEYEPRRQTPAADTVLIVGDAAQLPSVVIDAVAGRPLAIIGPRASQHADARVTIDTGVAGIHVGGTAFRLDDVALPLRPALPGARDPHDLLHGLIGAIAARGAASSPGSSR